MPVKSIDPDDAEAYFGYLTFAVGLDNPTSSALTQALLGWQPTGPGLLDDLAQGHYFGHSWVSVQEEGRQRGLQPPAVVVVGPATVGGELLVDLG